MALADFFFADLDFSLVNLRRKLIKMHSRSRTGNYEKPSSLERGRANAVEAGLCGVNFFPSAVSCKRPSVSG